MPANNECKREYENVFRKSNEFKKEGIGEFLNMKDSQIKNHPVRGAYLARTDRPHTGFNFLDNMKKSQDSILFQPSDQNTVRILFFLLKQIDWYC